MEKSQIEIINGFIEFSKSSEFNAVISQDYNNLKEITNEIRSLNLKPTKEGEKECNKKKNRYRDILPYDESRVKLDLIRIDENKHESGSDYINASFITNVLDGYYKYIAAQGPSKETIVDFIRMLVQYNVKIVLCACNEYEGQKLKCHRYWTDDLNEAFSIHKNYYVTLKSKPVVLEDCIIRNLKVIYNPNYQKSDTDNRTLQEYEFTQIHLINWPDHGVPNNLESIINILGLVRKKMIENNKMLNESLNRISVGQNGKFSKKIHIPLSNDFLVVHCSAGCGRTGTIIAIDQLWAMINENKLDQNFSLYEIAKALREQRIAMIQTQSQYLFFARATALLFEKYLKSLSEKAERYLNNPVKQQILSSKIPPSPTENNRIDQKTDNSTQIIQNEQYNSRKMRIDSNNNNLDCTDDNNLIIKNSNLVKKDEQKIIDTYNLTPPKSPNSKLKSVNLTKSPLTSVKQKINRLVPNMFQIFTTNNNTTPTITNYTSNSQIHTPMSMSSNSSSSPSPLSVSSNSSASSSISKNTINTKILNHNKIFKSPDFIETPGIYSSVRLKNPSKLSTPTSTILYNDGSNFSSKSLFINTDLSSSNKSLRTRARSATRLNSNGTPTRTSPRPPRKLSSTSERSSEYDLHSQTNSPDNTELYLNDKSMSKKEPGSGCEFLTHKLNSNKQLQIELQSNNNIPKSLLNNNNEFLDSTKSAVNFRHIVNQAKLTNGKQIDLRHLNQPQKAEFLDSLPPPVPSDDQENKQYDTNEIPKPPIRTKIHTKRLNLNENKTTPIYNIIDIDLNKELTSSQNFSDSNLNQLPNKYVEIRLNKTAKTGANFESYSDNFTTRNYRNGVLLDINSNSQKDFEIKENHVDSQKPQHSYYKLKSPKYDILTLPNKKYIQVDKNENENKSNDDSNFSPFPFNSTLTQTDKNQLRQSSNLNFNKDLNINVQYVPSKSHYYYLINNLKSPVNTKFNNRKSLKIDHLPTEYYDNNFSGAADNFNENRTNNLSKRKSTQVFDL
ncbi:unnamed protein product [Brachionus calyciflorus]|uniref:protein-tyrosine-phosphatase n=1 Tax=Brachionus calyciflorus TaxID=104777 RepID=A0A813M3P9_9BILA|nr:unnamed protein product [Brachionus calyciflorus]